MGYSLVEGGWDGDGIQNDGGGLIDRGGNIDANPRFVAAGEGNLRLMNSSPAVDAGDNDAVPSDVTTDRDGRPRFADVPDVDDTGRGGPPIVDLGAYEAQGFASFIYLPLAR